MVELRQGGCIGFLLAVLLEAGLTCPAPASQGTVPEDPQRKTEGQENKKRVSMRYLFSLITRHERDCHAVNLPIVTNFLYDLCPTQSQAHELIRW